MSLAALAKLAITLSYVRELWGAAHAFKPADAGAKALPLGLTFWVMLIGVHRGAFSPRLAIPAFVLLLVALALFEWAARSIRGQFFSYIGSSDQPQFVFSSGPYAYIRHPFYSAYLLTHTGAAMMFPGWLTVGTVLAALLILWRATLYEEGKFAHGPHAEAYRVYMSHTGRFLPWV